MRKAQRPEILWCPNQRGGNRNGISATGNGWKFPPPVRKRLLEDCQGLDVLHLFGGKADFGTRLDIDPIVRPDVIGDAWLPPFARDSFDVVIMDPPYIHFSASMKSALFRAATWIARRRVIWFSTLWVGNSIGTALIPESSWLVRVGDLCYVRCLQYFAVDNERKRPPVDGFKGGPAVRYNRWLAQPEGLPLMEATEQTVLR